MDSFGENKDVDMLKMIKANRETEIRQKRGR
jgi:hypothetical protein